MIRHIVMWKFKPDCETEMNEFLSKLGALNGVIPEILSMEIGKSCVPGSEYQAVLTADFEDLEALGRYKNDPRHVAVSSLCKAIRLSRSAIDYEIEGEKR